MNLGQQMKRAAATGGVTASIAEMADPDADDVRVVGSVRVTLVASGTANPCDDPLARVLIAAHQLAVAYLIVNGAAPAPEIEHEQSGDARGTFGQARLTVKAGDADAYSVHQTLSGMCNLLGFVTK